MRLPRLFSGFMPFPPLVLLFLLFFAVSCDQDINSAKDQPLVNYVLVVSDSTTLAPLDSVRIKVTTITGDTSTYYTDGIEGRIELPTLASSRTLFSLAKRGYRTTEVIDTVNSVRDTVFNRPVLKLLRLKIANLLLDSAGQAQLLLFLRNDNLEKLPKGKVTFTDSLGVEKTIVDGDSNGILELSGLKLGQNQVRVENAGYLGRIVSVNVERTVDTSRIRPNTTVTLLPLNSSISGQIFFKTATGSKPLLNAKVEFHLKDSLAYPKFFRTFTATDAGKGGQFLLAGLPALEGDLWFYKDRVASEPTKTMSLSAEEVMRDGPLSPIVLTINQDSVLLPVATSLPDTLLPKDTLIFHFSRPVERMVEPVVSLINISQRLFTHAVLDSDKTTLRIVQANDDWIAGKDYAYSLSLFDSQGDPFTRQGDTLPGVSGTFHVRENKEVDTALAFPSNIHVTYFNSGLDRRFDSLNLETSRLGDSTTRFARLKWAWPSKGNRVDSLLVFIRDGGPARASWSQIAAVPSLADSATVDFADIYSTASKPSQEPIFPLLASANAQIEMKVIFLEGGRFLDSEAVLAPLNQGMGPRLYAHYDTLNGLSSVVGAKDSIRVTFLTNPSDTGSIFDFGAARPKPRVYSKGNDTAHVTWRWVDGKSGWLKYSYGNSESPEAFSLFRVDLGHETFDSKPIWHRNRFDGVGFE